MEWERSTALVPSWVGGDGTFFLVASLAHVTMVMDDLTQAPKHSTLWRGSHPLADGSGGWGHGMR